MQASAAFDRRLRLLVGLAVVVGVLTSLLALPLQGASAAGTSLSGGLDREVLEEVADTRFGSLMLVRAAAWAVLGAILVVAARRRRGGALDRPISPELFALVMLPIGSLLDLAGPRRARGHPGPRGVARPGRRRARDGDEPVARRPGDARRRRPGGGSPAGAARAWPAPRRGPLALLRRRTGVGRGPGGVGHRPGRRRGGQRLRPRGDRLRARRDREGAAARRADRPRGGQPQAADPRAPPRRCRGEQRRADLEVDAAKRPRRGGADRRRPRRHRGAGRLCAAERHGRRRAPASARVRADDDRRRDPEVHHRPGPGRDEPAQFLSPAGGRPPVHGGRATCGPSCSFPDKGVAPRVVRLQRGRAGPLHLLRGGVRRRRALEPEGADGGHVARVPPTRRSSRWRSAEERRRRSHRDVRDRATRAPTSGSSRRLCAEFGGTSCDASQKSEKRSNLRADRHIHREISRPEGEELARCSRSSRGTSDEADTSGFRVACRHGADAARVCVRRPGSQGSQGAALQGAGRDGRGQEQCR